MTNPEIRTGRTPSEIDQALGAKRVVKPIVTKIVPGMTPSQIEQAIKGGADHPGAELIRQG